MLTADGTVFGFGDAKPLGEPPKRSEENEVHLEPTSTGAGYATAEDDSVAGTHGY